MVFCAELLFLRVLHAQLLHGVAHVDGHGVGGAVGVGGCAAVAVCDIGFAVSLCGKLGLPKLEEEMKLKLERQKRRKAKKLAGRDKHDTSKRGK